MVICNIIVKNPFQVHYAKEPVSLGIPFCKGQVNNINEVTLEYNNLEILTYKEILQTWHDGSIRWLFMEFFTDLQPEERHEFSVTKKYTTMNDSFHSNISWKFTETEKSFMSLIHGKEQYQLSCKITNANNNVHFIHLRPKSVKSQVIRTTMLLEGKLGKYCNILLTMSIYYDSLKFDFTIHNSNRAQHKNGIWDLGDKGSFLFRDLSLQIDSSFKSAEIDLLEGQHQSFQLYQDSSGGENWNSINHLNCDAQNTTSFCGYNIYQKEKLIKKGKRAQPIIKLYTCEGFSNLRLKNFWQNFPKGIHFDNSSLSIQLFPKNDFIFELQGGEQKTHTIYWNFNKNISEHQIVPKLSPAYYAQTNTIDFFVQEKTPIDDMVEEAVWGKNSFIKRNEKIDEYGWRNFGDFFADHEAIHTTHEPFISHYNNQYDLIYSFFLQYTRTSEEKWYILMENLAQHVIDIDIYRTDRDKPSYNNGLFWHTNHYLSAVTATHRCYSRAHLKIVNNPNLYGGGPSNEHNYTTGLLNFYFVTGNQQAKQAVLLLASWVLAMEDGTKNIFSILDKGETGLSTQTYSSDYHGPGRGSGNSMNALLDAYTITQNDKYMIAVEKIIQRCIHPNDCFDDLELNEPEKRWSYTFFLQVLGKYLSLKEQQNCRDEKYKYAICCLLHYANWIVENEYFYLDKPSKLEYPTETWAAQEIRKVHVLLLAQRYKSDRRFSDKMHYFYRETMDRLHNDYPHKKYFVRPIAILMHWGNIYHYGCSKNTEIEEFIGHNSFPQKQSFIPQKVKVKQKIKRIIKTSLCLLVLLLAYAIFVK